MLFDNWRRWGTTSVLFGLLAVVEKNSWVEGLKIFAFTFLGSLVLSSKPAVKFYVWLRSHNEVVGAVIAIVVVAVPAFIIFVITSNRTTGLLVGLILLAYLMVAGRSREKPTNTRSDH